MNPAAAATRAVPRATAEPAGELPRALHALRLGLGELPGLLREVDAVAAKTKLLGFNAAILAAQAGSEGRSFAIVAEQMKALNQRAEAATRRLHLSVDGLRRAASRALELNEIGSAGAAVAAPLGVAGTDAEPTPPRPPPPAEVPDVPAPPERPAPEVREVPPAPEVPELPRTPPELPEGG